MIRIFRPIPVEQLRLIVFDLDGTLIDSRQDLCNSVNATLERFGLKQLRDETIAGFIGDGAAMLIRRALSVSPQRRGPVPGDPDSAPGELPGEAAQADAIFDEAFAYFLTYYRAHKLDFTLPYPGVVESLEALKTRPDGRTRPMAVLTNKPVGPAQAICEGLGLAPYFFRIYGGDSFATKKPDPEGLLALMAEAAAEPGETLLVGDSDVDVRTARNAGAWSLGCTFGLSPETLEAAEPDGLVDRAGEWAAALGVAEVETGAEIS